MKPMSTTAIVVYKSNFLFHQTIIAQKLRKRS